MASSLFATNALDKAKENQEKHIAARAQEQAQQEQNLSRSPPPASPTSGPAPKPMK